MTDEDVATGAGKWRDWSEIVAADMADPAFRALVDEIEADQERWARE